MVIFLRSISCSDAELKTRIKQLERQLKGKEWGLGSAPIRIPIALDSATSVNTPILPVKTVIISNTSYNSMIL